MYRIGVIGDFDSICGFLALGLDVFPVVTACEAEQELKRLCSRQYGIVYITEPLMEQMEEICDKMAGEMLPAIIPIPVGTGGTGFGQNRIREYVRQAVGSDILLND
jgi:V/A-type H+-transporting ATPase subunit F